MTSWVTAPGGGDLAVRVALGEAGLKPGPGPVGAAAQQPPGAVERILLVVATVQGVVLDAATDVVEGAQDDPR